MAKPPGDTPRVVFVGDSFVESVFTPLSLPAAVEKQAAAAGHPIEAVNLGVGATDPRSYYYRTRDLALKLSPDALLLFVYAGNDFVAPDEGYSRIPALIDESPGGSLLASVMPHTNWLLVNRLRQSGLLRGKPPPPDEVSMLDGYMRAPPGERTGRLVAHVRKYYYPELSEEKIREILSRGDDRLWRIVEDNAVEQEYLLGWVLDILLSWEARDFDVAKDRAEATRRVGDGEVRATLSWIEAIGELAHAHHVPMLVFLIPVGSVDPAYVEYWKPWPRAYSWNHLCDERAARLATALGKTSIRFVDLRKDLDGITGTYRKLDGHWTAKGEAIVADRVDRELGMILGK
jgi:hypothetical protein